MTKESKRKKKFREKSNKDRTKTERRSTVKIGEREERK